MKWFPDISTIVIVGGISIKWYVVTLVLGCVSGFLYLSSTMKKHGYKQSQADDIFILVLLATILGGRVAWVFENLKNYSMYAWYIFAIWDGGIDILGSFILISLVLKKYCGDRHLSFRRTMDIVSVSFMIGLGISRVGRALEGRTVWFCVAFNAIELLVMFYSNKIFSVRKRGDALSLMFMLTAMDRLMAMVFKWDPLAVGNIWLCVIVELIGLFWWAYSHYLDRQKPVVLFDFDGTIMDSEQMIIGCFAYLFQRYGNLKDFTKEVQKEVFGPPLREELKKLFPDQDTDKLMKEYQDFQKSLPGRHLVQPMPHMVEVLKELNRQGYIVGIVTSRLSESCETWIEDLEIEQYFKTVTGTERYRHAKPRPDGIVQACEELNTGHDSVVYVGDNVSDVVAGKNAGVFTVAYITDPDKREKIEAAGPNATIFDIRDLLKVLNEKHSWSHELV